MSLRIVWIAAVLAVVAMALIAYALRPGGHGERADGGSAPTSGSATTSGSGAAPGGSDQTRDPAVTTVRTAGQLQAALDDAQPGDTIALADGVYRGQFEIHGASGTAASPITLVGGRAAVLTGASLDEDYGLHVEGSSHWRLSGFTVTGSQKGIVLDSSAGIVLDNLDVGRVGQEGVHLRSFSHDNIVQNCDIHDTGLRDPSFGEGIYIGSAESNWKEYSGGDPDASNGNQAIGNRLRDTAAEGLDIKEGTSGGVIEGNTIDGGAIAGDNFADSYMDVKGNGYRIQNNTLSNPSGKVLDGMQTHEIVDGDGSGNSFVGNVLDGSVPGYGINIDSKTDDNVVSCSNQAAEAAMGLSNVDCRN